MAVTLRAEVVRSGDPAARARVGEAAARAAADAQERLAPPEPGPESGAAAAAAAAPPLAAVCEQLALSFRRAFEADLHVVVGKDVTAAVRISSSNRVLLRVTASGLAPSEPEAPGQRLTALVYQSVSARALPPAAAGAAEAVPCRPAAAAEEEAPESSEDEDGFVDVTRPPSPEGAPAPAALPVEVLGRYGEEAAVGGALLALERSCARHLGRRGCESDADVERVAQTVRQSLSLELGHLWHVLASREELAVCTALRPAPEAVVRCRAAGATWVVFRHSARGAGAPIDWALFRREMMRNGRLLTLVCGALALFYFHTACGGSLSSLAAPAPAGESAACYGLRTALPWVLAALAFLMIVPRIQASARRRARRKAA